ncbi:MAG: ribosome assembly RNA-binding protein YhbY [Erysipelothrix sp.]|nr:ribosome assembly RNA-binding protein YhbY [Erysipelothrix sp.]
MILNNQQKKFLKSLGHELRAVVMVGKDGVNPALILNLKQALNAHELVKVSMLNTSPITVNEAAIELASETKSEVVSKVGRVIVLYKQSEKKLIQLPK